MGKRLLYFWVWATQRKTLAGAAAHNAVILGAVARMAYLTLGIYAGAQPARSALHDEHYLRKHAKDAYCGLGGDGE
jgi:ribulose-5-phosphate 4-epimerase/fuculose-1-phosphate aldolase